MKESIPDKKPKTYFDADPEYIATRAMKQKFNGSEWPVHTKKLDGQPNNIEEELRSILTERKEELHNLTRKDRHAAIEKETAKISKKYTDDIKLIDSFFNDLIKKIKTDNTLSRNDIVGMAEEYILKANYYESAVRIERIGQRIGDNNNTIKRIRELIDNPENTVDKILETVFNYTGGDFGDTVKIMVSPYSLALIFKDKDTKNKFFYYVPELYAEVCDTAAGMKEPKVLTNFGTLYNGFLWIVADEYDDNTALYLAHESQHILTSMKEDSLKDYHERLAVNRYRSKIYKAELIKDPVEKQVEQKTIRKEMTPLGEYAKAETRFLNTLKTEILSFYKTESTSEDFKDIKNEDNPLFWYKDIADKLIESRNERDDELADTKEKREKLKTTKKQTAEEIMGHWCSFAANAIQQLEQHGFSKQEIIDLLTVEELNKWNLLAKRLIKNINNKE